MTHFTRPTAIAAFALAVATLPAAVAAAAQPAPTTSPVPGAPPAPIVTPTPMVTPAPMMSPSGAPTPSASASASASASPGASPGSSAANVPPENPLVTQRVRDEFVAWQRRRINRKTYSPQAGGTYIDALVAITAPELQIGAPQSLRYRSASLLLGDLVYRYDVTGDNGVVSVLYSLDGNGKTDGIVFTPEVFRSASVAP